MPPYSTYNISNVLLIYYLYIIVYIYAFYPCSDKQGPLKSLSARAAVDVLRGRARGPSGGPLAVACAFDLHGLQLRILGLGSHPLLLAWLHHRSLCSAASCVSAVP